MCRFVFYRGRPLKLSSLITEPEHSIIHQSYHSKEREEPLNGDGFGVGWYSPDLVDRPVVFKDISPAWNNMNLASLAPAVVSDCIVGHIRAASPGLPVTQLNCHPFTWRRFMFAHNGVIGGFREIKRRLTESLSETAYNSILGSTDSEALFALFIDEFAKDERGSKLQRMASALRRSIDRLNDYARQSGVTEPALLNLILTDGTDTTITRYVSDPAVAANSLYLHTGAEYECINGACSMNKCAQEDSAVIVASEPLSSDQGWRAIEPNSMLLVGEDLSIDSTPLRYREDVAGV